MITPDPQGHLQTIHQARELEELAEREATGDVPTPATTPAAAASEVFSIRLPVQAAVQLREAAAEQGISPGVLLRGIALRELAEGTPAPLTLSQVKTMLDDTVHRAIDRTLATFDRDAAVGSRAQAGPNRSQPAAPPPGLNLGPRQVHQKLRERRIA